MIGDNTAQLPGSEYVMLKNQIEKEVGKMTAKYKECKADKTYIHNCESVSIGDEAYRRRAMAELSSLMKDFNSRYQSR